MLKNWKSQEGYTGIDVAVSVIVLLIFTLIISTVFVNIYIQYTDSQRNSVAMSYLTSVSELIDKMYYQDVYVKMSNEEISNLHLDVNESLQNKIQNMFGQSATTTIIEGNGTIPDELEVTISNSYKITITISRPDLQVEDLVKNVRLEATYKVNNTNKSIKIDKIKAKEVLITPNKPQLSSDTVPVKFIVTDPVTGEGYWQISSENDSTWYNYENRVWASVMMQDGLIVEGGISVTEYNMAQLIGKKIIRTTSLFKWIPRFVLSNNEVVFLYSTSDKFVNSRGNLQNKDANDSVSSAFTGITGFWIATSEESAETISGSVKDVVSTLSQSEYGSDAYEFRTQNISNNRKIIIVR